MARDWMREWEEKREREEEEAAKSLQKRGSSVAPPTPPTPPTATSPGPDEEPKEPAEPMLTGQGMLFDPGQPICPNPHCGALLDEASMQTGKCYVCDEHFNPEELVVEEDEELLDDQTRLPFD